MSEIRPESNRGSGDVGATTSVLRSAARRDQLVASVLALVLLVAAILLRPVLGQMKRDIVKAPGGPAAEASLKRLAIEFPRLTLGGFRGLLATILWQRAEEAKNDRQWMRLETLYDSIAVLQPYIVSVYVFHAWNQAYNLSAQWHEQENKYKWVLDGLSYLYKGEDYNPGAADIQYEQANMYFLKLGGSFERIFYREQWRTDLARLYQLGEVGGDTPQTAALRHVRDFASRPEFKINLLEDPRGLTNKKGYGVEITHFPDDATEGPTLKRYYGVSPFYFAYRAYQRTLANREKPTTTGISVIDAWPAMSLRLWCRDDLYYSAGKVWLWGRRMMERPPTVKLSQRIDEIISRGDFSHDRDELRDCFANIQLAAPKAVTLFGEHLNRFPGNEGVHKKHKEETRYYQALGSAENATLEFVSQFIENRGRPSPELQQKQQAAVALYRKAQTSLNNWINTLFPNEQDRKNNPDIRDYQKYGEAMDIRIAGLTKLMTAIEDDKTREDADFTFLAPGNRREIAIPPPWPRATVFPPAIG